MLAPSTRGEASAGWPVMLEAFACADSLASDEADAPGSVTTAPIEVSPPWFVRVVSMQFDTSSDMPAVITAKSRDLRNNASPFIAPPPSDEHVLRFCSRREALHPTAVAELAADALEAQQD